MDGSELIEVVLQAFVVGVIGGALIGGVKTLIYNFLN